MKGKKTPLEEKMQKIIKYLPTDLAYSPSNPTTGQELNKRKRPQTLNEAFLRDAKYLQSILQEKRRQNQKRLK